MSIENSELILNPDGSVYHLQLKPIHIAPTVLLVGDQNRVEKITKHFDNIEFSIQKREFKTITGVYKGKRLTVISTGIGPDNIDIVLNELDALVNIDLKTRTVKETHTALKIIRIGTSGALQKNIPVGSYVLATHGLGLDGLLHSYSSVQIMDTALENAFIKHTNWSDRKARPYCISGSNTLIKQLSKGDNVYKGITLTAPGFYGPQGRILRLALQDPGLNNKMNTFSYKNMQLTNLEMETSAIYGLSKLLGHHALSMNAIIANRPNGTFSEDPYKVVENLIQYTLNALVS